MATLNSPGVAVTVINESFYTPAAPGTVPLIVVASASNKTNPSGTTAPGTLDSNAGKVYTITSQRDLTDTFGTPLFYTDASGNPINGSELNEYGLQAAYSLLGVSSQALIVRAPLDLSQLHAQSSAPTGAPTDGAYWLDTSNTLYGIFEWSAAAGTFANKTPIVINDSTYVSQTVAADALTPKPSVGTIGSYCVVSTNMDENAVWYKNTDANWVKVGTVGDASFANNSNSATFASTVWSTSWPAVTGTTTAAVSTSGNLTLNGITIAVSAGPLSLVAASINNAAHTSGIGAKVINGSLAIFADASAVDGSVTVGGDANVLTALGLTATTFAGPTVFVGPHTQYPNFSAEPTGSVYMKTTSPNAGAVWTVKKYSATTDAFSTVAAPVYSSASAATYQLDKTSGGALIPVGTLFVESNFDGGDNFVSTSTSLCRPVIAEFKIKRRAAVSPTTITGVAQTGTVTFTDGAELIIAASQSGTAAFSSDVTITVTSATTIESFVTSIQNSGVPHVTATVNTDNSVSITHATGGEIKFIDANNILGTAGFVPDTTANLYAAGMFDADGTTAYASNWMPLTYTSSATSPSTKPANGQLWYSSIIDEVDLMWNDGSKWVGYGNAFPGTDPLGPIVAYSAPTTQRSGSALVDGDVWVYSNTETYGQEIYVWNGTTLTWVLQDPTDQTSPTGWVFHDARWSTAGQDSTAATITALRSSDYVDPDVADPAEYPRGTRLWNLRRSGFNIKQYVEGYININSNNGMNLAYNNDPMNGASMTVPYNADRWVSVSPNNANGSGTFGRHAQRAFVVKTLKATIDVSQAIRDTDTLHFNLIACPGYIEVLQNLIGLNTDRGLTSFVVGDTPFRLAPTGTALAAWGNNTNGALDNGDVGIVSFDDYTGVYYPSGYTNDNAGNYIVVPPSHMMLRTIAESDQKSYPWFAPAGIRRGVVDNATSVGYINASGEFNATALPQNIRDVMAGVKVNPIATISGAGIIAFGQYTRANAASALDRINVARLTAYLRRQLDVLARPFLFEPNDKITRNEAKNAVQKLMLELVGQRAIYDFIVVCDESNNTPDRVDRSELWIDVAIEPVKAVEFIYIPVRLVNTGSIKAGTYSLA